jgi:hypothetical protein
MPVQMGDRLGLFLEQAPSSVSHRFNKYNPVALTYPLKNGSYANLGDSVTFDTLNFPYEFSLALYIDIGM